MTTPTDPQSLIQKARDLCKAATPGPWESRPDDGSIVDSAGGEVVAPTGMYEPTDATLIAAAPTLLLELAEALSYELKQTARLQDECDGTALEVASAKMELADHKAKMVDLLAAAYEKGRRFGEDTDDRTSEDG